MLRERYDFYSLLETDPKGKGLLSPKEMKQLRGKSIGVDGKQIVLSDGSTSEEPGLYGGMWRGDGPSTSEHSRSANDNIADIMRIVLYEKYEKMDISQKLDQAHQEIRDKEKIIHDKEQTIQQLTSKLEEMTRERDELNNDKSELLREFPNQRLQNIKKRDHLHNTIRESSSKLEEAHQEIRNKEQTIQNLTSQLGNVKRELTSKMDYVERELMGKLEQTLRENGNLAKQLKEARLDRTSSLQKGESSSQVINWEDVTPWRKYYEPHGFAQIPKGEEWFDKNIDKWVFMPHGSEYMKQNAHLLIATAPGSKWFGKKGEQWIESWDGRIFMSANAHLLIATAPGSKWFKEKGDEWIKRDDGRSFMRRKAHLLLITDPGASWFEEKGDEWIESENSRSFMRENAHLLIATVPGRRWFEEKGVEWLRGEDGQLYRSSHDGSQNEFRELNAWYRNKTGNLLIWGHNRYEMYI